MRNAPQEKGRAPMDAPSQHLGMLATLSSLR